MENKFKTNFTSKRLEITKCINDGLLRKWLYVSHGSIHFALSSEYIKLLLIILPYTLLLLVVFNLGFLNVLKYFVGLSNSNGYSETVDWQPRILNENSVK